MSLRNKIDGLRAVWKFDNRLALIVNKTLFPNEHIHFYRYRDVEFLNDHAAGDANGARDVIFSEMYSRLIAMMKLGNELAVFDLGANNGGFPLMLKAHGLRIGKVVSVELNPETAARLRFNLNRNFGETATSVNAGVCGEHRELELSLGSGDTGDNIYGDENKGSRGTTYKLPGRTFDSIYTEHFGETPVDICKVDVEGAEFEIFEGDGAEKVLRCRYLIMEIHKIAGKSPSSLIDRLISRGFALIDGPSEESVYLFENSHIS